MRRTSFERWVEQVDEALDELLAVGLEDVPGLNEGWLHYYYDDGIGPREAVLGYIAEVTDNLESQLSNPTT